MHTLSTLATFAILAIGAVALWALFVIVVFKVYCFTMERIAFSRQVLKGFRESVMGIVRAGNRKRELIDGAGAVYKAVTGGVTDDGTSDPGYVIGRYKRHTQKLIQKSIDAVPEGRGKELELLMNINDAAENALGQWHDEPARQALFSAVSRHLTWKRENYDYSHSAQK